MTRRATADYSPARRFWLAGPGREIIVLLFLALIALAPRAYQIGSAPNGLNGDELFNAIDALRLGPGHWVAFFEGNLGREALFLYLVAVPLNVFGQHVWAIRLPAVLLGTGTVFLAYGIGTLAFNRRIGFVAGLLIAVSLWPVMQSRFGLRAVSLTFFTALTIYLYLLAIRASTDAERRPGKALGSWIVAGIALGLTLYTYIPARVFPVVILAWFAWILLTRRALFGRIWRRFLLSLFLALVVFAPFGIYMIRYPEKVNQRIEALQGANALEKALDGQPAALLETALSVPLMFSFQGDTAIRYHYDARPVFDPLAGAFFYLGLAAAVWLAFRRQTPDRRSSYGLLLLWMAGMLAPNIITGADASFLRGAGAIVPIYLLAALGVDTAYSWLRHRWPEHNHLWRAVLAALVALGGLLTLADTWRNYFERWVNDDQVRQVYRTDLAEIGQYLARNPLSAGADLFIAYDYVAETTPQEFAYYSDRGATWFDNTGAFAWRPSGGPAWYVVAGSKPLSPLALSRLSASAESESILYESGDEAFSLYRLDPLTFSWLPSQQVKQEFVTGPTLLGFDMPVTLTRGESVPVTLHWSVPEGREDLPNRLTYAQLFLEDESGLVWQRAESLLGYPEAGWKSGDRFVTLLDLEIPEGMPPGQAYVRFGLRDWLGEPYAETSASSENDGSSSARSGPYLVRSRPAGDIVLSPDAIVFDDQIALQDFTLSSQIAPGLAANISLDWLALKKPDDNFRVRLQLTAGPTGEPLYAETKRIWPNTYPPASWTAGEQVTSFHRLQIPLDLPAVDDLWLRVDLLPSAADSALPLSQGSNALTSLDVDRRTHSFEVPDIARPLEARFGEQVGLLGYELTSQTTRPGESLDVTLYWQALETPSTGYTVFSHLIGDDGQIRGQFDGFPSGDAWFTGAWLPGEVVVDRRVIPVDPDAPAGSYTLYTGLYTAGDGQRLPAFLDGRRQTDDRLPLTTVTVVR